MCSLRVVEVLGRPVTFFSRSFVLGLFSYLRQAELSLDRAPVQFPAAMRAYYDEHGLPSPARVVARLDAPTEVEKALSGRLLARLFGAWISFDEEDLKDIRESLLSLDSLLEMHVEKSHEERIRIRLDLSEAEELVRRKLGRRARQVELVEHLNQNSCLATRPLSELAGANWPELT